MVFDSSAFIFATMMHGRKVLICLVGGGLLLCGVGYAATPDPEPSDESTNTDSTSASANPYQAIVERNVFGLKPPPPPPDPESQKPPMPKITLTGISTLLGNKRAFLKTPAPPAKPGEPPKSEQFYMLTEGQRDGEMEVIEIDEKAGAVKVKYAGTIVPLDFVNNGAKLVNPPPVVPGPGGIPSPTGVPGALGVKPLPTRTLRLPTPGIPTPGSPAAPSFQPSGSEQFNQGAAGGSVPMPIYGAGIPNPQPTATPAVNQLPLEQQYLITEAERERTKQQVASGLLPPLPPTPFTPAGSPGSVTPDPNQGAGNPNQQHQGPPRAPTLPPIPGF
jgi:hypothetical protein